MTGRERLNSVLRKRPTDRLPWTTLVDERTLCLLPDELRASSHIDFCRHLGCDMFMLNGWGTQHSLRSPELRWSKSVETELERDDGRRTVRIRTPKGELTRVIEGTHPVKYAVDSIEAVHIYRDMWEGAMFTACDDTDSLAAIDEAIEDDGVVTRFWGPSTIPRLLEEDMGTENFYYLMADNPDEMHGLIQTMHEREMDAFGILADGPWDSITLCENTSTFYISPDIYKRYNMPHQRDFVTLAQDNNKVAILHMCGHVRNILDLIKETGCDGIHALTPEPTGDTPWEEALDVIGDDLIILGILDPSVFISGPIEAIPAALDEMITPRLRESHFVLHPAADGIPVPLERFEAVKHWMDEKGITT